MTLPVPPPTLINAIQITARTDHGHTDDPEPDRDPDLTPGHAPALVHQGTPLVLPAIIPHTPEATRTDPVPTEAVHVLNDDAPGLLTVVTLLTPKSDLLD